MVGVVQDLLPFPLPSSDAKIHRCSGPSYKIAHLWDDLKYMHPPIYFNSSLDYLQYLIQCKFYVNSCKYNVNAIKIVAGAQQIQVLFFGTFWNFSSPAYFWSTLGSICGCGTYRSGGLAVLQPPPLTLSFPLHTEKPTIWLAKMKTLHGSCVVRTQSNLNSDTASENVHWYNHFGKQFTVS